MDALDDLLIDQQSSTSALGSLEGHKFAPGECRLFLSCPDADELVKNLEPG
ncbi:MAG: hypothetical protein AAGF31_03715 [Planctomycetota bacterium]